MKGAIGFKLAAVPELQTETTVPDPVPDGRSMTLRKRKPVGYAEDGEDDIFDVNWSPACPDAAPKRAKCSVCRGVVLKGTLHFPYGKHETTELQPDMSVKDPDLTRGECSKCFKERGPYIFFTAALSEHRELTTIDLEFAPHATWEKRGFFGGSFSYWRSGRAIRSVDLKHLLETDIDVIQRRAEREARLQARGDPDFARVRRNQMARVSRARRIRRKTVNDLAAQTGVDFAEVNYLSFFDEYVQNGEGDVHQMVNRAASFVKSVQRRVEALHLNLVEFSTGFFRAGRVVVSRNVSTTMVSEQTLSLETGFFEQLPFAFTSLDGLPTRFMPGVRWTPEIHRDVVDAVLKSQIQELVRQLWRAGFHASLIQCVVSTIFQQDPRLSNWPAPDGPARRRCVFDKHGCGTKAAHACPHQGCGNCCTGPCLRHNK